MTEVDGMDTLSSKMKGSYVVPKMSIISSVYECSKFFLIYF